jgi:hypothetical protein
VAVSHRKSFFRKDRRIVLATCRRCLARDVSAHVTAIGLRLVEAYDKPDGTWITGMFPLCEGCWIGLAPAERLPYYRAQWLSRGPGPQNLGDWFHVEAAVLAEVPPGAWVEHSLAHLNWRDLQP